MKSGERGIRILIENTSFITIIVLSLHSSLRDYIQLLRVRSVLGRGILHGLPMRRYAVPSPNQIQSELPHGTPR